MKLNFFRSNTAQIFVAQLHIYLRTFFVGILLVCSMPAAAHPEHAPKDLRIEGAWLRAMPPVQTATAGYFTLYNDSAVARTLTGASCSIARQVEMHGHVHMDGMARMRAASEIELPAGGRVEFAPGAYHLMLMGIIRPLTVGDWAMVNLEFADGSRMEVRFPVRDRADDGNP